MIARHPYGYIARLLKISRMSYGHHTGIPRSCGRPVIAVHFYGIRLHFTIRFMPHCKRSSEHIMYLRVSYVNSKVCPTKRKHHQQQYFVIRMCLHMKKNPSRSHPVPAFFRPLANIKRRMFQVLKRTLQSEN